MVASHGARAASPRHSGVWVHSELESDGGSPLFDALRFEDRLQVRPICSRSCHDQNRDAATEIPLRFQSFGTACAGWCPTWLSAWESMDGAGVRHCDPRAGWSLNQRLPDHCDRPTCAAQALKAQLLGGGGGGGSQEPLLQELIRRRLLQNGHRVTVELLPDPVRRGASGGRQVGGGGVSG
jgi:hypothetical protein